MLVERMPPHEGLQRKCSAYCSTLHMTLRRAAPRGISESSYQSEQYCGCGDRTSSLLLTVKWMLTRPLVFVGSQLTTGYDFDHGSAC